MIRKAFKRFMRDSSGAAALEFALIATPLLMFTFGIIEIGRLLFMQQQLTYATDAAARQLYIAPNTPSATLSSAIVDDLFLGDPLRLTVTVGTVAAQAGTSSFQTIRLTVDYDFQSVVPKLVIDAVPLSFERTVIVAK